MSDEKRDIEQKMEVDMQEPTSNGSQSQLTVAGTSDGEPQAKIFKLDIDCFEELFEWLSLENLLVLRQTSKQFKQLADYYIKEYCPGFKLGHGKICINWEEDNLDNFRHLDRKLAKIIKQISLNFYHPLDDEDIDDLKGILSGIEVLAMEVWLIDDDFYEKFLQFCPNVTKLAICWVLDHTAIREPTGWLAHKYPKLEYIRFNDGDYSESWNVPELKKFFELNPNVQTFSTTPRFLAENQWIFGCGIQLDVLEIWANFTHTDVSECCDDLHTLYQQGFYKRLHFTSRYGGHDFDQIQTLQAVEALYLEFEMPIVLPSHWMNSIKELGANYCSSSDDTVNLAKNMMNVERFFIGAAYLTYILEFVRHSAKVKEIRVDSLSDGFRWNNFIIDVPELNKEREQLVNACMQTIYVPEAIYLATKWAGKPIKCSLIQLKRLEACQWEPKWDGIYIGCYNPELF